MGLFGGIGKALFGSGESKTKTTTKQYPNWNPEQQELFKSLVPMIQSGAQTPAAAAPQMYVPQTAQDKQYFDWAKSQAVKNMATGVVPYQVGPEYAEQYWQTGLKPIYDYEWQNTILPGLQEQYAGSTFNATGRDEAVRKALQEFGLGMGKEHAALIYGEEQAKRQAIDNAYSRIATGQEISGKAAEYSRTIETERVMDQVARYLMGEQVDGSYNPAYNPMVAMAFNLLGLQPYSYGQNTKSESSGPGIVTGFLGGVGQGLGTMLGGKLFSSAAPKATYSDLLNAYGNVGR